MDQASYSYQATSSRKALKGARRAFVMWLIFLPLVFIIFVPIMYMITMAFTAELYQFVLPIRWIPQPITLNNFQRIFA
ncbi:MAG: hypothetical protein JW850_20620, partial [Thermoflexales bacterium]|nr:hypothetical protein [Thermoflexales bacterium]